MTRCHYVQTRLNSDEARNLQAICTIRGKTRSAYIRSLILRDIREALDRHEIVRKANPQMFRPDNRY